VDDRVARIAAFLQEPSAPRDRAARPSLDEMLALRAGRMATMRQVLADLTDDQLAGMTYR
jgi:hypothetical protein